MPGAGHLQAQAGEELKHLRLTQCLCAGTKVFDCISCCRQSCSSPHAMLLPLSLQTLEKLFSRDWARACGKEKFTSMLARENKGNAAGKSDKAAMQEVHDTLKKHYQVNVLKARSRSRISRIARLVPKCRRSD